MKNLLSWLPIILFFAAAGLMFAADRLAVPVLTFAGVTVLGLTAIVSGIQVILTRQAFFLPTGEQSQRRRAESYSGLAAQIWGVMFVLFGLIFIGIGLAGVRSPGQVFGFLEQALETSAGWGALLLLFGLFLTLYGLTRVLAGGASTGSGARLQLRDMGYRLFGGVVSIVGLLLLGLGFILFTSPETLSGMIRQWIPLVP